MPANSKGSWTRTPYTSPLRLHHDDKKGLGYGVVEPTGFNRPRKAQGNFPYLDPDFYADDDGEFEAGLSDEELDTFVTKINRGYLPSDFLAAFNPFYFVAGNTKLSEAPSSVKNSTVTIFGLCEDGFDGPAVGGFSTAAAYTPTSYKRTGTVQGWSHLPPPLAIDPGLGQYMVYDLRDMPDKDERTLLKLRVLINDIIRQQEDANRLGN